METEPKMAVNRLAPQGKHTSEMKLLGISLYELNAND